jgi:hypothetical protein
MPWQNDENSFIHLFLRNHEVGIGKKPEIQQQLSS